MHSVIRHLSSVIVVTLPSAAHAQLSLRAGALHARYGGNASGSAVSIAPRVDMRDGPARGSFEINLSSFANSGTALQAGFEVSTSKEFGRAAVGLTTLASGNYLDAPNDNDLSGTFLANVAFGWTIGRVVAGVAGGAGYVRPRAFGGGSNVRNVVASLGAELGGTTLLLRGQQFWLRFGDYRDVNASVARRQGRLSFEAMAGARFFDTVNEGVWQVATAVELRPSLALEASAGRWPSSPEGFARGTFGAVGFRVFKRARLSPALAVVPAGPGRVRVTLTVPGRRELLIGGDWNEWTPVPMRHEGGNRWSIELPLGPGAHKFAIRRGDEWMVPDGVPSLPDDFGGRAGLIVVS